LTPPVHTCCSHLPSPPFTPHFTLRRFPASLPYMLNTRRERIHTVFYSYLARFMKTVSLNMNMFLRVHQAEYGILIRVAASQDNMNLDSTRRVAALPWSKLRSHLDSPRSHCTPHWTSEPRSHPSLVQNTNLFTLFKNRRANCVYAGVKGALCACVIRLRVSYSQNDETLSRNSLMYMSKANLPIAVHQ